MHESVEDLHEHYDAFKREFHLFFKDLMVHATTEKERITQEVKK